ncbi:ABC transporter permease [Chloroflexota bacterium]
MPDLAWKNLWVRKVRTILTIIGIGVALELVILMTTIVDFTEQSLQGELAQYAGQMYVRSQVISGYAGQEFPPINSSVREDEARQIIEELGTTIDQDASTLVVFHALAPPPWPSAPPEALVVALDPDRLEAYLGEDPIVKEGAPQFSSDMAKEVILGPFAHAFFREPSVGDKILVAGEQLQVVAVLEARDEADRITAPVVLMPLDTAQEILNQPGSVSAVLITAARVADVGAIADNIRQRHPKLTVLTQEEIADNINKTLEGIQLFFGLINNTAYVVAAVVVMIVMIMAVSERTREIGTIRAIGGSRWLVLSTIIFEAMLLGLVGGILSVPIAFLLNWVVGFGLEQIATVWGITQVILSIVVLSVVAALIPAWRATRINPVEALRYE